MGKYELIKPTEKLIEQYNRIWNGNCSDEDYTIQLFEDVSVYIIDKETYFKKEYIDSFSKDDKEIKEYCEDEKYEKFFTKLNSVYHTRLKTKEIVAIAKKWNSTDKPDRTLDNLVEICKKITGSYAYSFATKVFSFIDAKDKKNDHPIMDRYVVNMLKAYFEQSGESISISSWGDYSKYKEAYDKFKKECELEDLSYKKIDEFLWMYGKLLECYWKKEGVLMFDSTVSYKSKK